MPGSLLLLSSMVAGTFDFIWQTLIWNTPPLSSNRACMGCSHASFLSSVKSTDSRDSRNPAMTGTLHHEAGSPSAKF